MADNSSVIKQTDAELNETMAYWSVMDAEYQTFVPVYQKLTIIFMSFGLFGNSMSIFTLVTSPALQTSHFIFYKFLAIAECIYCLNYFIGMLLDTYFKHIETMPNDQQIVYSSYGAAVYQFLLARFLYSSTSYTALYMSVLIAFDRYAAVWLSRHYQNRHQRNNLTLVATVSCCCCATLLNSWETFLHYSVAAFEQSNVEQNASVKRDSDQSNRSLSASWTNHRAAKPTIYAGYPRNSPTAFSMAQKTIIVYNMIIRLLYPVVLVSLSVLVIWGLVRFRRRRSQLFGRVETSIARSSMDPPSDIQKFDSRSTSMVQQKTNNNFLAPTQIPPKRSTSSTAPGRNDRKKERHLFYLMAAVVVLALVQLLPRETKRFLDLRYPDSYVQGPLGNMKKHSQDLICSLMRILMLKKWLLVLSNLASQLDRSLKFYVFVILNEHFKQQVLKVFCPWRNKLTEAVVKFRSRFWKVVLQRDDEYELQDGSDRSEQGSQLRELPVSQSTFTTSQQQHQQQQSHDQQIIDRSEPQHDILPQDILSQDKSVTHVRHSMSECKFTDLEERKKKIETSISFDDIDVDVNI